MCGLMGDFLSKKDDIDDLRKIQLFLSISRYLRYVVLNPYYC